MGRRSSGSNRFTWIPSVAAGTRPAAAWGTSITPVQNAYGSYAQLLAGSAVTSDVFGILLNFNSFGVAGQARDCLAMVGIDEAGGTSYTDKIPHLLCNSTTYIITSIASMGGMWYWFPLFIKAGSSIGVCASINNATVGTGRAACWLATQPTREDLIRCGSFVRTFGEDTANSRGTLVTQGTTSEGSYVQLGSAIADPSLWAWEFGVGCNNNTMNAGAMHADIAIGDASNKKLVIEDEMVTTSTSESLAKQECWDSFGVGVLNDLVYGRLQSSQANDANISMIAYGIGG